MTLTLKLADSDEETFTLEKGKARRSFQVQVDSDVGAKVFDTRVRFRESVIVSLRSEQRRDIRLWVTCAIVPMARSKR